jgi:hypothetical protein
VPLLDGDGGITLAELERSLKLVKARLCKLNTADTQLETTRFQPLNL